MDRRAVRAALALLPGLLLAAPALLEAQAFLVKDVETEAIPLPDPSCPFEPEACAPVFGSLPDQLTPFGDRVVFSAFESASGRELWISDGTAPGTRRVADLLPGEAGSRPTLLGVSEHGPVFCATIDPEPAATACDLFVTDGTGAEPLGVSDAVGPAAALDGFVYFQRFEEAAVGHALWRTDGTPGGTTEVHDLCPFPVSHPGRDDCDARLVDLLGRGDSLYLVTSYTDLDDPARPTVQRLDRHAIAPPGSGLPDGLPAEPIHRDRAIFELTPFRDGVLFVVHRPTFPVPVPFHSFFLDDRGQHFLGAFFEIPASFTANGPVGHFQVDTSVDGTTERRIWRTDGTPDGTEVHLPDLDASLPTAVEDLLFFVLDEGGGAPERWLAVSDADGGLTRLLPVQVKPESVEHPTALGRRLFVAAVTASGSEPWTSDGTPEGTARLADVAPGAASSRPRDFTRAGDLIFFTATNEAKGRELWAVRLSDLPALATPEPPWDAWIDSPAYPDFRFQVRITAGGSVFEGREEADCQPETVCVSGALPGRSEAFLRIVGPRPNGYLWPTIVRFTPSRVEVWIEQTATGERRHYRLEAVAPGGEDLPGLQDRRGFLPE